MQNKQKTHIRARKRQSEDIELERLDIIALTMREAREKHRARHIKLYFYESIEERETERERERARAIISYYLLIVPPEFIEASPAIVVGSVTVYLFIQYERCNYFSLLI